jgi:integrative and conjugative element protein (TIGR02256 family)
VIYLCISAFATIRAEAQHARLETGGVLSGYETAKGIVIVRATGPGPAATHRRHRVELDLDYIRHATTAANNDGLQYQGSWHKHLSLKNLWPSFTDRRLLRRPTRSDNYQLSTSVMIITNEHPATMADIRAYTCNRSDRTIREGVLVLARDPD